MLLTLDPEVLPRPAAVPGILADADALAAWLNTEPALVDTTPADLARAPWLGEFGYTDSALALWCERPQDAAHVAGLLAYFCHGPLALGDEWQVDPLPGWAETGRLFVVSWDLTKSRRDDVAWTLTDLETGLEAMLITGTPVRTTDRAGVGTKGTRKWAGLAGRVLLAWR